MKKQLTMRVVMALLIPYSACAQAPREAIVAAETAFAAQSAQAGTGPAFVAHSAPGALVTEQGRWVDAQELWKSHPAQASSYLAWHPVLADVAQSGDLGYTTGPWTSFRNNQPQTSGEYVNVWRKQPNGKWKFVVDMSIERIGTAPAKSANVPQPRLLAAAATPSTAPANIVIDIDRKFAAAHLQKPGASYQQYLSSEARLYRPGLSLMQGAAAAANMKNLDGAYAFTPVTGYLAAAGDLGYVVGTLKRARSGKNPEESGSYLRIWRREAVDGWRVVLEIFNFTPTQLDAVAAPVPDKAPASGQLPGKPSN